MEDVEKILMQTVTEIAKDRSKDIYDDGFKRATQEIGSSGFIITRFLKNKILFGMEKDNMKKEYELLKFQQEYEEKAKQIPSENFTAPPLNIVGPVFEKIKYRMSEEEIRKLFAKLLSSSSDKSKQNQIHPSFVTIIENLSSYDAQILKILKNYNKTKGPNIPFSKIKFRIKDNKILTILPNFFNSELLEANDPYEMSFSLSNLVRLEILNILEGSQIKNYNYDNDKNHKFITNLYNFNKLMNEGMVIQSIPSVLAISDYGKRFMDICLD